MKTDSRWERVYPVIYILRRLTLIFVGLYLFDNPGIQLIVLLDTNMFYVIYIGLVKPKNSSVKNNEELYHEVMLMLVSYCLLLFTRFIPEVETQYLCGWCFIAIVAILVAVSMYKVCLKLFIDLWKRTKKGMLKKYYKASKSSLLSQKKITVAPNVNQ